MPLAAAVLGLLLTLPSIGGGLMGDDYIQRSVLLGVGDVGAGSAPVFDMFAFVPQGPRREATMALGTLGWWAHPQISIAFFRPFAALTHVLDYVLWPDAFFAQHLHNLFWYALAIAAVAVLYREVEGVTPVAGLAAVLFAVEDAHAMCAGWLANRHALIALVFGVFALLAHMRWRRRRRTMWFVAAITALAVALMCGEAALGAAAYIVAWELAMEDGPWTHRFAALVPYGVFIVGWRVIYEQLGFGTTGTPLYIDPGHHPLEFLLALAERWPILQLAQWGQVPVDLFVLLSRPAQVGLALIAIPSCLGLMWLLAPVVAAQRSARFWAGGMCLSLVPLCAAFPMDRLLLFSGIGAFALLAQLAAQAGLLSAAAGTAGSTSRRVIARILLVMHGPLAAALLAAGLVALPVLGVLFEVGALTAPADHESPRQTYVFVNGQEFPVVYLPIIRQLQSPATAPRRVVLLASMFNHNEVFREDDATLVVSARDGFLRAPVDQLLRSLDIPFSAGEQIVRRDFTAEVRAVTPDGRPARVAFHFRAPLESREFRWLSWGESGAQAFQLPSVGQRVELPAVSFLPLLVGQSRTIVQRALQSGSVGENGAAFPDQGNERPGA